MAPSPCSLTARSFSNSFVCQLFASQMSGRQNQGHNSCLEKESCQSQPQRSWQSILKFNCHCFFNSGKKTHTISGASLRRSSCFSFVAFATAEPREAHQHATLAVDRLDLVARMSAENHGESVSSVDEDEPTEETLADSSVPDTTAELASHTHH